MHDIILQLSSGEFLNCGLQPNFRWLQTHHDQEAVGQAGAWHNIINNVDCVYQGNDACGNLQTTKNLAVTHSLRNTVLILKLQSYVWDPRINPVVMRLIRKSLGFTAE